MPGVYEYRHTVEAEEIDVLGHANNVAYVEWLQAAAVGHSNVQGWPGSRYQSLGQGWVVRSHYIEYLHPAFAGDELVVRTWVVTMSKVSSTRRYRILRPADDTLVASAETRWAFINYRTGLPQRIPPEVLEAFQLVDSDGSLVV